jgi:hypothetical protein
MAANRARAEFNDNDHLSPFLQNEESVVAWIRERHVNGDIRQALKTHLMRKKLIQWSLPSKQNHRNIQGEFVQKYPEELLRLSKLIRNENNPQALLFLLLSSCQWLPTKDKLSAWSAQDVSSSSVCSLCNEQATESFEHTFNCPFTRNWLAAQQQSIEDELNMLKWPQFMKECLKNESPFNGLTWLPNTTLCLNMMQLRVPHQQFGTPFSTRIFQSKMFMKASNL